jgi:uncharacterized protein (DUF305 family)
MKRHAPLFFAFAFAFVVVATAAAAQTNDHDRMFADSMTRHHQDGIRMAQMAVDKTHSAELRSMAQRMIEDQRREIGQMQSLRGDGPMTPMSEMMQMPGMMPESEMQRDMARLESATGHAFDMAFTEIMPKHHDGAIEMAKHELQRGSNAGLKEIARQIADKQSRERQQLLAMHENMSDDMTMTSSSPGRRRMSKD